MMNDKVTGTVMSDFLQWFCCRIKKKEQMVSVCLSPSPVLHRVTGTVEYPLFYHNDIPFMLLLATALGHDLNVKPQAN